MNTRREKDRRRGRIGRERGTNSSSLCPSCLSIALCPCRSSSSFIQSFIPCHSSLLSFLFSHCGASLVLSISQTQPSHFTTPSFYYTSLQFIQLQFAIHFITLKV